MGSHGKPSKACDVGEIDVEDRILEIYLQTFSITHRIHGTGVYIYTPTFGLFLFWVGK